MGNEKLKSSNLVTEIREFIDREGEYPVNRNEVEKVIKEAQSHSEIPDVQTSILRQRAVLTAVGSGFINNTDKLYPNFHIPTILAAVREMEKDMPEEKKRLPLPLEVQILAVAEYTNAKRFADENFLNIASHAAENAIKLTSFNAKMKMSREFSWYFVKVRE